MKPQERFKLEARPLGAGGYAKVFRATNRETGQIVALKRMKSRDLESRLRFKREIEVLKKLRHAHIVELLDSSPISDWYTMPVAEGNLESLRASLSDDDLVKAIQQAAAGLMFAHDLGYIHRDVTPRNILAYRDDQGGWRWVISDWGLVRRPKGQTSRRITQGPMGTEGFLPPESWNEESTLDARADIYSLGRVAAWAITRKWPAPNLPLVPEGRWQVFIRETTQTLPESRPQTMLEASRLLPNQGLQAPPLQFLLWWEDAQRPPVTRWCQADGRVLGTRTGLLVSEGPHLWRWRTTPRNVLLAERPTFDFRPPTWRERLHSWWNTRGRGAPAPVPEPEASTVQWTPHQVEDAYTDEVLEGISRRLSSEYPPAEGESGLHYIERQTRVIASLGPLLFIRAQEYQDTGGAHGNTEVGFLVFDLTSGREADELSAAWIESRFASEREVAVEHFKKVEAVAVYSMDEGNIDVALTLYRPFYTPDGKLRLELQFTAGTVYAQSDGHWSSYTQSFHIISSNIPEALQPFAALPPELLPQFVPEADGHPRMGWSLVGVNSGVRSWLEREFHG